MAYLALARKWRPKAFSEVVGQSHVVKALSNALESGRVHHAFLFTGTRGVGKTTLARIFAKSLNCEQGTSAEPCQECSTCVSIDEGRYVDLIEVDAASRTKVDDTRELLDNVQYAPTYGKYKVFLIDEVHMLSGHSFNALLKTLEEPPEHVKFLFATTDPQKLPVTVLSRCLQFNLRAMRPEQIENQLLKVLGNENLEYDQNALAALAKAADGSMRDGLSLLDQAIAQGAGEVRYADVQSMLGTIKSEHSSALIQALGHGDADKIMQTILDMADHAVDFNAAIDDLLMQLYNISLAQLAPASINAKDVDLNLINSLAEALSPETVQLYYQIGLIGKRDIALAPSLRVGFEMAMLRMLAFEPTEDTNNDQRSIPAVEIVDTAQAVPEVKDSSKLASAPKSTSAPTPNPASQTGQEHVSNSAQNLVTYPTDQLQPSHSPALDEVVAAGPVSSAAENSSPAHNSQTAPVSSPPAAQAVRETTAPQKRPSAIAVTLAGNNEWGELVEQTQLIGLSKELAMNCSCERLAKDQVNLSLSPKHQHLFKAERAEEIQAQVQLVTGENTQVEVVVEDSEKETPAECLDRLGYEQLEQTKTNLQNDPGVKALMSEFGATINEQSVKPNE